MVELSSPLTVILAEFLTIRVTRSLGENISENYSLERETSVRPKCRYTTERLTSSYDACDACGLEYSGLYSCTVHTVHSVQQSKHSHCGTRFSLDSNKWKQTGVNSSVCTSIQCSMYGEKWTDSFCIMMWLWIYSVFRTWHLLQIFEYIRCYILSYPPSQCMIYIQHLEIVFWYDLSSRF